IDSTNSCVVCQVGILPYAEEFTYGADLVLRVPPDLMIEVFNAGGEISSDSLCQSIWARALSGPVNLRNVHGDVDVATSDDSLSLVSVFGSVAGSTTNAPITAGVILPPTNGHCRLETTNGAVILRLQTSVSDRIYARPVTATVTVSGLEIQYLVRQPDRIEGVMGSGSNNVYVSTSNRSIALYGFKYP
ncbi:MAG: hypothetical protein ABIK62_04575, partial [candidate division WOR-3 bacterium]